MMRMPPLLFLPKRGVGLRARGGAACAALALSGCARSHRGGVLDPTGPVAQVQHDHLLVVVAAMAIVLVPIFVVLPWILWRYRLSRKSGDYRPDWDFDKRIEWAIWGVPVLIVAGLAVLLWTNAHRIDPYRPLAPDGPAPVRVQAVGLDWKWLFIYPDEGVASVDELVVPAGRDIAFELTADGPMMSMLVPQLGGQIYAMAGMRTRLHLQADRPGAYRGLNTQYNGRNFARQEFTLRAVSPQGYDRWLREARKAPPLDAPRYARLARPSLVARPLTFGATAPDLFARIMAKYEGAGGPAAALPDREAAHGHERRAAMASAQ